ncbi:hypothetical protein CHH92_18675 [Bacillus sonorensis]|nr:hypothetical protein [Bacillus sonorensis]PAD58865.1 hypothetical protein CHH92_18675 [Bacillus sonorensis]RHJ06701.1 hypothetical protein DW143_20220 [Bacillus sonorensis]
MSHEKYKEIPIRKQIKSSAPYFAPYKYQPFVINPLLRFFKKHPDNFIVKMGQTKYTHIVANRKKKIYIMAVETRKQI